jgi:tetratricopeptide (TPR) repeat protein
VGERVARERLRVAEEHGAADDVAASIDALAHILLGAFGPAGPGGDVQRTPAGERPDRATALRHELVALRRREAQLARAGGHAEKAWELLQQASALAPGEPIVLADLTELAEELGRYDDLAELVQSWQAIEADPSRALALSIRRADALLRGGQRDQAQALLVSLEASAPGFVVLTSAAEREALGRNATGDLARAYASAAHAALLGTWLGPGQTLVPDPAAAAALWVQAAELYAHEVVDGTSDARAALGRALQAVPDHPAAREAELELDEQTGEIDAALARLAASARNTNAGADERRAAYERAIRLARGHGRLETVAELQRGLAELLPGERSLRWRLEATLAQIGRDDERAALLAKLATDETDAAGRGTALLGAARLYERTGGLDAATDLYRQLLASWPDDAFARESLIDLLRAQERWAELVAERRAEAAQLPDGPAARRALREAAWVLEIKLGDAAQAARVYDEWVQRLPDDRLALEGAARCHEATGNHEGEIAARAAIAQAEPSADPVWMLGRALERAGQSDEAADQYRALIARSDGSVAATAAAIGLGELAAARGDTVMRVEATAALAARTSEPRFASALAEDSGWMYALVLEDFDRAAQSFEAAVALEPGRRGALLGAALVAARRGDPGPLGAAYESLASAVEMPEAAATLLLRGALVAASNGDIEQANRRVAAARAAAPDDVSALLVVAEAGAANARGVDQLLARAEVLALRGALADDLDARASWDLDRAEALELAGRLREAGTVVATVLKARPDDLRGLSALHRIARRAGDRAATATSAYALARVLGDRDAKLELLREAAAIFDGQGMAANTDYAVSTYKRIIALEPGADEHGRWLELLRERADVRALVAALTDRIAWFETEGEGARQVPLLLERATVLHARGDSQAAMTDLDALLDRAPDHAAALRFRADLAFNAGDATAAVALWRRYLAVETRPDRRGEIELQLSQVLAENTGDLAGAIEQLERVIAAHPEDLALRERLLGLCTRASDWERAIRELRALARLRPLPGDKAREELRLALVLRDRGNDKNGAKLALDRARTLDPLNLDVVRELAELVEPAGRGQVLAATATSLRGSIATSPMTAVFYERLAQVNAWQADVDARWVALVAVEALATPQVDQRQVLTQGRAHQAMPVRVKLDPGARAALRGGLGGALLELWRAIAPAARVATGVDPAKLGFARGDRLALKKLGDKFEPLAVALAAFGLDDVELYINPNRTGVARALAGETPVLCLGAEVAAAATPTARFALGRAVAHAAEGIATLPDLRDGELEQLVAAALRAVDAALPAALAERIAGQEPSIAERAKLLKKELSRKARGAVQQLAQARAAELGDVDGLRRHALAVGQRAGLLWCGDLAVALALLDVGRGGRALIDSPWALELVSWSVSEAHLKLRDQLGVAIKVRA